MQFSNVIARIALVSLFLIGTMQSHAQLNVNTPYSRYALGETNTYMPVYARSMGGLTAAMSERSLLNPYNPASYSFLEKRRPVFHVETSFRNSQFATATDDDVQRTFSFGHFGMGIPIAGRGGVAFGLTPYSNVGYRIVDAQFTAADTVFYRYSGTGNISRVYLGGGYMPLKNERHKLSIGVNGSFLFGNYTHQRVADYDDNLAFDAFVNTTTSVTDFTFDAGLIYKFRPTRTFQLTTGFNYIVASELNGWRSKTAFNGEYNATGLNVDYSDGFAGVVIKDTAFSTGEVDGFISAPSRINAGFIIELNSAQDSEKNPSQNTQRVLIGANFFYSNWSSYQETYGDSTYSYPYLDDQWGAGLGVQFTPTDLWSTGTKTNKKYWDVISYRLGLNYTQSYLTLNNTSLTDVGINFGLGLPLTSKWDATSAFSSYSMLNLNIAGGERGTVDNNLIRERYLMFSIGLAFSPHRIDEWFRKRKYD